VAPETVTQAQRAEEQPEPEPDHRPTLDQLIRHCAMSEPRPEGWRRGGWSTGTSDAWVANDFMDCLLPEARPEDRPALRRYRAKRMAHPDFKRREWDPEKANTHRKVIGALKNEAKLAKVARLETKAKDGGVDRTPPTEPITWCTCDGCKFERRQGNVKPAKVIALVDAAPERRCVVCLRDMSGKRAGAKACSKACRSAVARTKARVPA
jgi:hypothetical protein